MGQRRSIMTIRQINYIIHIGQFRQNEKHKIDKIDKIDAYGYDRNNPVYIYIGQIDKVVKVDTVDMRERNEDKHKYRQIGRQIDGQRERQTGAEAETETNRDTHKYTFI